MPDQYLMYEAAGGIARLTINRPDRLNALSTAAMAELGAALEQAAADPAVRCLILTGAGDRAFIAGADISELEGLDGRGGIAYNRAGQQVFRRLETLGKPSIAAVNGYALGGGCELALACTLRVASERARFGLPELSLGLIPGFGGTQRLSRLIGAGRALELILTGRRMAADEALACGLVNRVVPPAGLLAAAEELARQMMAQAPLAVALALDAVSGGADMPLDAGLAHELALSGQAFGSRDKEIGIRAFLEKRKPEWTGR